MFGHRVCVEPARHRTSPWFNRHAFPALWPWPPMVVAVILAALQPVLFKWGTASSRCTRRPSSFVMVSPPCICFLAGITTTGHVGGSSASPLFGSGPLVATICPSNLVMVPTTMNSPRCGHYRQWRWFSSRRLWQICLHLSHSAGRLGRGAYVMNYD